MLRRPPGAALADERRGSRLALTVLLLCLGYVVLLAWIDRGNGTFQRLGDAGWPMLVSLVPVSASYLARYWRWQLLLRQGGCTVRWAAGLRAYLAGFALTATPGKAGELLRIRYFARTGVPAQRTFAMFVFERACDLLVVLGLSLFAASVFPALGTVAASALCVVVLVFAAAASPALLSRVDALAARLPGRWLRSAGRFAVAVAGELRTCLGVTTLLKSVTAGSIAWGLTAAVFVWLCSNMLPQLEVSPLLLFGIYPLAMLVGALSFVPGGVGTTELAIVLMLQHLGVALDAAIAVAVATRLITLWYAILVGALAMLGEESARRRNA